MSAPSVLDVLRQYTAPRGFLVALLFVISALIKVPTVLAIVAVHLLERAAERLLTWANQVPPSPLPRSHTSRRGNR